MTVIVNVVVTPLGAVIVAVVVPAPRAVTCLTGYASVSQWYAPLPLKGTGYPLAGGRGLGKRSFPFPLPCAAKGPGVG